MPRLIRKYTTTDPKTGRTEKVKIKGRKGQPVKIVRKTYEMEAGREKRIQKEVVNLKKKTKRVKGKNRDRLPLLPVKKADIEMKYKGRTY